MTVVVPMYNAERTIERTLTSIRTQSVLAIQIVVVDDGSVDGGTAIVERHAAVDDRIELVRQSNQGVAVARNTGAALATAPYIAFIDADDLWATGTLERQLARFGKGGAELGVVYSWFTRINDRDEIESYESSSLEEGDILKSICVRNFIGNGSSAMIRRDLFEAAGGFDPTLRAQRAEGCEDYDLFCRLAERAHFGLVRSFDIGYRQADDNMSGNLRRMARSRMICASRLLERHPDKAKLIRHGRRRFLRWSLRRAVRLRRWDHARSIAAMMIEHEAISNLIDLPSLVLRGREIRKLAERIDGNPGGAHPVFEIGSLTDQDALHYVAAGS